MIVVCVVSIIATIFLMNKSYDKKMLEQEKIITEYSSQVSSLQDELLVKEDKVVQLEEELNSIKDADSLADNDNDATEESKVIPKYEIPVEKRLGPLSGYDAPVVLIEYEGYRYGYENAGLNAICNAEGLTYDSTDYRILLRNAYWDRTEGFVICYVIRLNDISEEKYIYLDDPDSMNNDDWKNNIYENRVLRLDDGDFVKYNN